MIGRQLAHYEIVSRIGAGGMGEVYRAKDTKLGRDVALKVLPTELAGDGERLRRFLNEARAVAALNHPNIVTIYSVEDVDGLHFLTMELIQGTPLGELIPPDGMTIDRFLDLAAPLIEALGAAHALGVVHRDLKPSNVMVTDEGRVKILDFGLATFVSAPGAEEPDMATRTRLTGEGMVVGTMPYMSPEQVEGRTVDPRSDLFSLGIVLYEMAAGRRPFHGDTAASLMSSILKDTPPPATALNPALPASLAELLGRCLSKDPAERFQTTQELLDDLGDVPREPSAEATDGATGFAHDVFISYAHLDNEAQLQGQEGWVSAFHRSLEVRVGQLLGRRPVIFRDPKRRGDDAVEETQMGRLPQSALLITVLSPRYVKSEWCHRELETFLDATAKTGGPKWGSKYRVFKVVKTPTPVERHPEPIQPLAGYEFFKVDPETGRQRELDQIFGPEAQRDYWARLDDLAHDVVALIEQVEQARAAEAEAEASPDSSAEVAPAAAAGDEQGAIYLAQTTYDLKDEHDAMRRDLQRHGWPILPEQSLPLVGPELEQQVREDLARCRMSIHLVGRNYGVVPEGVTSSVVEAQNDLALERAAQEGFQRVVWIPPGVEPDDDRQRRFLDRLRTDPRMHRDCELMETPLEDLKTVVHQLLRPPARTVEPRAASGEAPRVYLICDQRDQEATQPLADFLFDEGLEVTLPVFEGDEAEVREDHEDNLRVCDAVLLFYGSANELWLRRKLREVQKSAALGRTKALRARGIWVAPPSTPKKLGLRTREALVLTAPETFAPGPLRPFLDLLSASSD